MGIYHVDIEATLESGKLAWKNSYYLSKDLIDKKKSKMG